MENEGLAQEVGVEEVSFFLKKPRVLDPGKALSPVCGDCLAFKSPVVHKTSYGEVSVQAGSIGYQLKS